MVNNEYSLILFFSPGLGRAPSETFGLVHPASWQIASIPCTTKYSNFRNYATPLNEKCCMIMEKLFLCSLGKLFVAGFASGMLIWGFIDVPEKMKY